MRAYGRRMDDSSPPVGCSLSQADAQTRLTDGRRSGPAPRRPAPPTTVPGCGCFPPWPRQRRDLATREMACCPFLTIKLGADAAGVLLDLTTEQSAALPVVHGLAGVPASG